MCKLPSAIAAVALVVTAAPAFAQSAPAVGRASDELPMGPGPNGIGETPGVGATAGVIVAVDSPAARCSRDAAKAADGLMTPNEAVTTCSDAITSGIIPQPDLAGTLVNRGVLLMTMAQPEDAKGDFERALQLAPEQAEALVNRAILLLGEGKARPALEDLDRALALGPERPERAYYTRGQAREALNDIKGAYADYKTAESLKPDWQPVLDELSRFRVVSRTP